MQTTRLYYLDSARGIASLIVLFSHYFGAFGIPGNASFLNNTILHFFGMEKLQFLSFLS
jgi:hypothetical protein